MYFYIIQPTIRILYVKKVKVSLCVTHWYTFSHTSLLCIDFWMLPPTENFWWLEWFQVHTFSNISQGIWSWLMFNNILFPVYDLSCDVHSPILSLYLLFIFLRWYIYPHLLITMILWNEKFIKSASLFTPKIVSCMIGSTDKILYDRLKKLDVEN